MPEPLWSYEALRALPDKSVVQDANGMVWCVQHFTFDKGVRETWLCPFSDEYSFYPHTDDSTYALGETPALPIADLGVVTSVGG